MTTGHYSCAYDTTPTLGFLRLRWRSAAGSPCSSWASRATRLSRADCRAPGWRHSARRLETGTGHLGTGTSTRIGGVSRTPSRVFVAQPEQQQPMSQTSACGSLWRACIECRHRRQQASRTLPRDCSHNVHSKRNTECSPDRVTAGLSSDAVDSSTCATRKGCAPQRDYEFRKLIPTAARLAQRGRRDFARLVHLVGTCTSASQRRQNTTWAANSHSSCLRIGFKQRNLHHVWDSDIIDNIKSGSQSNLSAAALAQLLSPTPAPRFRPSMRRR